MSEAAEYPVKDIMVTGNVSLQRPLLGGKSLLILPSISFYYVLQNGMDGTQCAPTPVLMHKFYLRQGASNIIYQITNVTLIGCMI